MPFGDGTFLSGFLNQPIDVILFQLLIAFGWIPIAVVLFWGFAQMWYNQRVGNYLSRLNWVLLAVSVPPFTEQSPKALENLFANLQGAKSSILWKEKWIYGKINTFFSFEIASTEGYIQFFIRCETRYRDVVEAGIYAHYPDAEISEVEDYTKSIPSTYPNGEYETWGAELTLKKDDYLPIRTYVDFEDRMTGEIKDPLGQILEQMGKMKPGEHFWIQILFHVEDQDWKDAGMKFVREKIGLEDKPKEGLLTQGLRGAISLPSMVVEEATGISLTDAVLGAQAEEQQPDFTKAFLIPATDKEQIDAVTRKISKTGHRTKVRLVYIAKEDVFWKQARTALVKGMLNQFTHHFLNSFGMYGPSVPKDDYFWQRWVYRQKQSTLVTAYQNRSFGTGANPSILNTEELATLWHFPAVGVKAPLVVKSESRRGEPPVGLPFTHEEDTLPRPPAAPAPTTADEVLPGLADAQDAPQPAPVAPPPMPSELPAPTRPTRPNEKEETVDVPTNLPI